MAAMIVASTYVTPSHSPNPLPSDLLGWILARYVFHRVLLCLTGEQARPRCHPQLRRASAVNRSGFGRDSIV